jgi:hypothetical protein
MPDDIAKTESELTEFFTGLEAGLNSLREVRTTYDEQIAFNFNMLRFFNPGETKISEILAFFLSPTKEHGQKSSFLQTFLEHFNLSENISALLSADEKITVKREYRTEEDRRIDITVFFENAKFAIGIENKINAEDQDKQVLDYCVDLGKRTQENYKLLYLSPEGGPPSEGSIPKAELKRLSEKIKPVSYGEIVDLLKKYEIVCRADNVRGFIRQFQQYIKQDILREPFMDETNFVVKCLRDHPHILKHTTALENAANSLRKEFFDAFWVKVAENLKVQGISIDLKTMEWHTSRDSQAIVEHLGSPLDPQVAVRYDPKKEIPDCEVYIASFLDGKRQSLSQPPKDDKVERLVKKLKSEFKPVSVYEPHGWSWGAIVPLTPPQFNSGDAICEFLQQKVDGKWQAIAAEAANNISKYIGVVESLCREI